jgi:uncharacterized membrane protein
MSIFKHFCRFIVLWVIFGLCYAGMEILYRGYTFIEMVWIGGLCGVLVGLLNQMPIFSSLRIWQQSFIGTGITILIEFVSGYIFNIQMHLNLWNYNNIPLNFMGQICLRAAIAWFFLMPFVIYLDDWLRWKLFNEPRPNGNLLSNYAALLRGE